MFRAARQPNSTVKGQDDLEMSPSGLQATAKASSDNRMSGISEDLSEGKLTDVGSSGIASGSGESIWQKVMADK